MAKQQAQQAGVQESEPADSNTDVDIDGEEGAAPKLGMQDMKGLNSKLTKLATTHSIHLLQKDELVLLLSSLGANLTRMTTGIITLIEPQAQAVLFTLRTDVNSHLASISLAQQMLLSCLLEHRT